MRKLFRLCLVFKKPRWLNESPEIVASDTHYRYWDDANSARVRLYNSPECRCIPDYKLSVVVMSNSTFMKLQDKGDACTMARIQANTVMSPRAASAITTKTELKKRMRLANQLFEKQIKEGIRL